MNLVEQRKSEAGAAADMDSLLADLELMEEGRPSSPDEVVVDDGPGVIEAADNVVVAADESPFDGELDPPEAVVAKPEKTTKPKKTAEPKAPKEVKPKAEPKPRIHFANKAERLQHNLGDQFAAAMLLEKGDLSLEGDALATKQAETLATIMGAGVKVQTRVTFVLEFVMGKSGKLNEVMKMALSALKTDGFISSAADAGFMKAMFAKYTSNTAKAMGNNTLLALKALKVIKEGEAKGKLIANPESLILEKLGKLGAY